jgi:hypothetical protein
LWYFESKKSNITAVLLVGGGIFALDNLGILWAIAVMALKVIAQKKRTI